MHNKAEAVCRERIGANPEGLLVDFEIGQPAARVGGVGGVERIKAVLEGPAGGQAAAGKIERVRIAVMRLIGVAQTQKEARWQGLGKKQGEGERRSRPALDHRQVAPRREQIEGILDEVGAAGDAFKGEGEGTGGGIAGEDGGLRLGLGRKRDAGDEQGKETKGERAEAGASGKGCERPGRGMREGLRE